MHLDYAQVEYFLAAAVLVTAMLGMGAAHTVRDFLSVVRAPQPILLVMTLQWVVGPLTALLIAKIFHLPTPVLMGLLLIAALPGGSYSNLLTYLGRGNVPLSVAATAVCTAASLITTPLVLKTIGAPWFPAEIEMPVQSIFQEIAGWLLAPLFLGMLLRRVWPTRAAIVERWCIRLSFMLLFALVVVSLRGGHVRWHIGWRAHLAAILMPIAWLWTCYAAARLFRFSLTDAFTIAVEVVVRNGGLGLLLTTSLFPANRSSTAEVGPVVLYVVLLYSAISFVVAFTEVMARRRGVGLIYGRKPG